VPAATDSHPLHGELPNVPYQEASLVLGRDARGEYLGLGGRYRHTVAFSANYTAEPLVKLYAGSSLFAVSMTITNLKRSPMELMYLAHINFRPVDHATLVDTALRGPGHVGVRADLPDYQTFPAEGDQLLLWVTSERGRAEPEVQAAEKLARQGVEVWSLDLVNAYFLPQLPSSMDRVPQQDLTDWMRTAVASGKQVTVYAVARAAAPVLRAAAQLEPALRDHLCLLLMYPNLYTVAEPLAEPDYLDLGSLSGLRVKVLQPRRSAATPWLPGLMDHMAQFGASVAYEILENLREGYWARETPTEFEVAEGQRMDAMFIKELNSGGCK